MRSIVVKTALIGCLCSCVISMAGFRLGVESISDELLNWLHHHSVGLVTNQTGRDQQGARTIDILVRNHVSVKTIFVPEHGFSGTVTAAKTVPNSVDKKTAVPIVSLYARGSGKKIAPSKVRGIDALIFDIQDCGMRHFTYISTLFDVLNVAAAHNKTVIVFDRPNPLGPNMEGPLVAPSLHSFQAIAPIPLRHGMTIGELARYFNRYLLKKPAQLKVVPMKGYVRIMKIPEKLAIRISPNLQSRDACYGYSFLGLLGEVRPFQLGVGTDAAFCCIALPKNVSFSEKNWAELSAVLKNLGIQSMPYTYVSVKEKKNRGVRIAIEDINAVSSMKTLLAVLNFFKKKGVGVTFSPSFDRAVGTSHVREYVQGRRTRQELAQEINHGLYSFYKKANPVFMYAPHPKIIEL